MGMLSTLQPQQHRAAPISVPDTPPELVSPSSSTYSSLASEGLSTWRSRSNGPLSPPMSSYDQPLGSAGDSSRKGSPVVLQIRSDMTSSHHNHLPYHHQQQQQQQQHHSTKNGGAAPKQQLPSLSSLFPSSMRTQPSPLSERPPSHAATSPLELPRSAGGYLERSGSSSSYFPALSASVPSSSSSSARPVLYEPKLLDAPSSAYATQPRAGFPGPLSPGLRVEPSQQAHRADSGSSGSRWSFQQDMARGGGEYSISGRDHASRYHQPSQLAGQKHDHDGYAYRDPRITSPHQYQPHQQQHHHHHQAQHHAAAAASTPASSPYAPHNHHHSSGSGTSSGSQGTPAGETVPSKDGLGPKIWTGTHFLPRFVRAAELPGEGLCYFYDDGSHCKTVIDGEAVNAHWGVTKAGKPRKRLAIACVTCREKKIKCDPDYPRCVQCEKFGRVCRFKNAPRGGGHHSTGGSGSPIEHEESPQHQRGFAYELPRPRHSPSVSPRTTEVPLALVPPPKRLKYDPAHASSETSPVHGGGGGGHALPSWRHQQHQHQHQHSESAGQLSLPRLQDESRWRLDPYPSSGLHSPNEALARRPQPPPQLPRFPDARV